MSVLLAAQSCSDVATTQGQQLIAVLIPLCIALTALVHAYLGGKEKK